jgi:hypothetical protein
VVRSISNIQDQFEIVISANVSLKIYRLNFLRSRKSQARRKKSASSAFAASFTVSEMTNGRREAQVTGSFSATRRTRRSDS